ncbi:protein SWEETIE [Macadamia integrifolia]|uniref:protein SWEETIE n=1 Tax=Macadamia integrifolia TaxID=60698 RepID=UPI001C4F803E|nr:protein SWEETIE [Macadamia integrifolia]
MAQKFVRENVPLSRFGVLVAQLESIVASASQQPPDALLCFDLLSDLITAIDEEPKESILLWQRKCEDALYSLLILGARRPVRRLASLVMARIILKGDGISIYSRASTLQGFLSDGKKSEPLRAAGAAQCLGELYHFFGRRITSGLLETTSIAAKLMKFNEDFVRQEALQMLQNALEGSGGSAASAAYTEAFRLIMRVGVGDKSFIVRMAAARCLKTFASIGGPGLGVSELDNSASYCVKALEDLVSSVRDTFAEALGAVLALGMNPGAQVQPKGKSNSTPAKKLDGCLQKHLTLPFMKATGPHSKDVRIGLTLSWVFFLQAIRLKYLFPDTELQNFAVLALDMLRGDSSVDAHALACVLYILRVGLTDQMTEPTQRSFLVLLGKQLDSSEISPSMAVVILRTISYTLKSMGEVPLELKEVLDDTVVAALSHSVLLVRIEAALTLRALAEVDPTCVGGLVSYAVTTLNALRESVAFEKGGNFKVELDSLHGQATVLAALVSISPKLPLGYPARLPKSVLEVVKKMLTESSRNTAAATAEKEAGWLLLASLISSMPKEELEDQVFDILSLWASLFSGNTEHQIKQAESQASEVSVWAAAVDALTAFIRCFVSPNVSVNNGVLLQPVVVYLSRALSYISFLAAKQLPNMKAAMDLFTIRTLIAYQSLSDPMSYKTDNPQIIQICTTPFRDPSGSEESSCLRLLLDKRDAWLGPWIPGRDWFEDELRAFQGGKDGLMPCVWDNELSSFPQPETVSKMLVNQTLLCFGIIFATQDNGGMLLLLGMIEQCLKAGKKQSWHAASVTNACVGLLAGLKALLALRPQPLAVEILGSAQAIFLGILAEGDICASQRRAAAEGLGLLARLGNDIYTARMTRSLLGDLAGATDLSYSGSIAFSLGCIHRSAGGMALSTLVPATVSSLSLMAKSSNAGLQLWSLHALLLTIEAAGLSYVSQVQATLVLAMEILLSEENGWVELRQGIGRLINAIVAVLGPELSPGSIFFSRCKSVVAEISSGQETSTLLESVRFTQQLVLFAPQAVSVHSHVQALLPTLYSRQPILRHLCVSTLRHLIEKDSVAIVVEQVEENLFHMLDEETDPEIANLVGTTIIRLLYISCPSCPSRWISICRKIVLATSAGRNANTGSEHDSLNGTDGDARLYYEDDDENMVASSHDRQIPGSTVDAPNVVPKRDKHLRYRTRVFAAECLSHLPEAVGNDPAHFDLPLARRRSTNGQSSGDWLVLHIQELIALAYQISTIQFENMQPIGVGLLSTLMDKFEMIPDPELPGHLLMEQYQAQLVSAVRTALNTSSGPLLLEAGLQLATKILTSGITSGDQAAVKRIFSLILRPLNDLKDLYYPSFAEWVACKIKIRLLAAHASVKCYTYAFLRRQHSSVPDEYLSLIPLFAESSRVLGKYWIGILKDYSYICFNVESKNGCEHFLDGIQSLLVSSKLRPCLEEAWPVILQAIALDAVPVGIDENTCSLETDEDIARASLISGYSMVQLDSKEFQFLWGFALLVLFQAQNPNVGRQIISLRTARARSAGDSPVSEENHLDPKFNEIVLPVFQFLSTKRFFSSGFLNLNICRELLQVFTYFIHMEDSWSTLVISVLSQIVQVFPQDDSETKDFAFLATEICATYLYKILQSPCASSQDHSTHEDWISVLFVIAETLIRRVEPKKQLSLMLAFLLACYNCLKDGSTESCFSKVIAFLTHMGPLLKNYVRDKPIHDDLLADLKIILGTWFNVIASLTVHCITGIHVLENKKSKPCKLLQMKLSFCLEQTFSFAKLAHEIEDLVERKNNNHLFFSIYKHCTKQIQMILTDSDIEVQTIGWQVLKNVVHRELGESSGKQNNIFMFFIGEFLGDMLMVVQKIVKEPITRGSMYIISECLSFLVLLQKLSKGSECQKGLINLLLEAIVIVVSAAAEKNSQELNEMKNTAVRLVSHLAQIPSAAIYFKDVLLEMPVAHRQQLQGIIRASVTDDQNVTQTRSTTAPPIIKLPVQTVQSALKDSEGYSTTSATTHSNEDMEEEDDWDAFQSFSATADATTINSQGENTAEAPTLVENSTPDCDTDTKNDCEIYPSSETVLHSNETSNTLQREGSEAEVALTSEGEAEENQEPSDIKPLDGAADQFCEQHQEVKEERVAEQGNYLGPLLDDQVVGAQELPEKNFVEDCKLRTGEIQDDGNDLQISSDPLPRENFGDSIEPNGIGDSVPNVGLDLGTRLHDLPNHPPFEDADEKTISERKSGDISDMEDRSVSESTDQHEENVVRSEPMKSDIDGIKQE